MFLICFCLIFSLMCFICVPRAVPAAAAAASQKAQFDCQKMCATPSTKVKGVGWQGALAVTPILKRCQRATFGGTANWRRQSQKAVAICSLSKLPWLATRPAPHGLLCGCVAASQPAPLHVARCQLPVASCCSVSVAATL